MSNGASHEQFATLVSRIVSAMPRAIQAPQFDMGKVLRETECDVEKLSFAIAEVLRILCNGTVRSAFVPSAFFIDEGWSYAEARNKRSATIGLLDDYSKATLTMSWVQGEQRVNGEIRRNRILKDPSFIPFNCDHFLDLWTNKEKVPEEWKKARAITFEGDVLEGPAKRRSVIFLFWHGGEWRWHYAWLDEHFLEGQMSAVFKN